MDRRKLNLELESLLQKLKLAAVRETYINSAEIAAAENWDYFEYLHHILSDEAELRNQNRIESSIKRSKIAVAKNFSNFDQSRLPLKVRHQLKALKDGSFIKRSENILLFGNSGSGKTHIASALGIELIQQGYKVYFTSCTLLIQQLLLEKRELRLEKFLKKLFRFDALILDDIGYVQQSRNEMEVFFTLLSQWYERKSLIITSNLPFSEWGSIFKDPMTTAAAIDRLIHHSVIIELNLPSYRLEKAKEANANEKE